jgi:O-antigen/teichoic acid export membrane protein
MNVFGPSDDASSLPDDSRTDTSDYLVPRSIRPTSTRRLFAVFGTATVLAQAGQVLWLTIGSRAMDRSAFGTVLAAQAMYGVMQFVVDNGPTFHGARLTAAHSLDEPSRSSIVRVRMQIAALAALATVALSAGGGQSLAAASVPYVVALFLWGLFNYWESYGRGDGRPLSSYLVLRAAGPPAFAIPFVISGVAMPVFAPGIAECASLIVVSALFHLHPLRSLASAARAGRGPWRKVITVGAPSIAWQIGLASGTIVLVISGAPEAAAILGVGVRLLTAVNQLTGVVATALFPALARAGNPLLPESSRDAHGGMIDLAARAVVCFASLALAIFLVDSTFFVDLLLHNGGVEAERTCALTLGIAGTAGISILVSFVLVARHRETIGGVAFTIGTGVALVLGIAIAVLAPANQAIWMAGALAVGQVVGMVIALNRSLPLMQASRRSLVPAAAATLLVLSGAVLVAVAQGARIPVAVGSALVAVLAVAGRGRSFVRPQDRNAVRR